MTAFNGFRFYKKKLVNFAGPKAHVLLCFCYIKIVKIIYREKVLKKKKKRTKAIELES